MKLFLAIKFWTLLAIFTATVALTISPAGAHERREVGKYQFVVGFISEPAFEGQKNGVDLRVTNAQTQQPVEGLQDTIQVELTHVPSGVSKVMKLRTVFREPGHYANDFIPTAPGQYAFRFSGAIEGEAVNERFESGPGRFNDVQSSAESQFPEKLPELRELQSAVRGAQNAALRAEQAAVQTRDSASVAKVLAIVGIVLGVAGIVSGVGSALMWRRKR